MLTRLAFRFPLYGRTVRNFPAVLGPFAPAERFCRHDGLFPPIITLKANE